MPGGLLHGNGNPGAKNEVLNLLMKGDVRCGTLECALGDEPAYDETKVADRGNVIYAKDVDVRRLKELHIDIVSLANNHFYDLGPIGADHTIEILDKEGILHCGAGHNIKEAGEPVVMEINGKKVAFLAFCDTNYNNVYYCTYATDNSPGVNPMEEKYMISEIVKYSAKYDYVVVLAHWGSEHTFYPNVSIVRLASLMLKAGACLILGSHPHRIQPVINTKKGSIAFSMGNFLFPERLIAPPKVTYYPEGEIDYSMLPVTDEYPIVDKLTLKTLPFWARVGQVVEAQLSVGQVLSRYKFTYLDNNNCLSLLNNYQSSEVDNKIKGISLLLKFGVYRQYMLGRKAIVWLKNRIVKFLGNK